MFAIAQDDIQLIAAGSMTMTTESGINTRSKTSIATNQTDIKSNRNPNPNPNTTTQQHAVSSKHSTKYSHMSHVSRKMQLHRCHYFPLSASQHWHWPWIVDWSEGDVVRHLDVEWNGRPHDARLTELQRRTSQFAFDTQVTICATYLSVQKQRNLRLVLTWRTWAAATCTRRQLYRAAPQKYDALQIIIASFWVQYERETALTYFEFGVKYSAWKLNCVCLKLRYAQDKCVFNKIAIKNPKRINERDFTWISI